MGNPNVIDFTTVLVNNPADGRRKLGCSDFDADLAASTTDDLREGDLNLYWTQARFAVALAKAISKGLIPSGLSASQVNALIVAAFPALFAAAVSGLVTVIDGNGDSDADTLDFNSSDYTTVLDCNGL